MPSPVYQPCRFSRFMASAAPMRSELIAIAYAQVGRRCTTRSMSAKTYVPVVRGPTGTDGSSSRAVALAMLAGGANAP
jgi:hypothetical protein